MAIDELRRLATAVAPIAPDEVLEGFQAQAATFNGVVARFRELVVTARNRMVQGHPIPWELGVELRALSEALPEERRRAARPVAGAEPGPSGPDLERLPPR